MQASGFKLRFGFILLAILLIQVSFSQTGKVSGRVVDENNKPVISATVKVIGLNIGTATDVDGRFV
ncbi:MAG TPA: hypothetical protein PL045_13695, partial [Chitinophagaceae bacterium]|nr:hypothetical protein [Chitinophagaceae bacterium]